MNIVKAEILWTRLCNLRCQYCNMYRTDASANVKKDWELWKLGLRRLKDLDCGFTAVYGAEPLMDMNYLGDFFEETNNLGIYHTLISNCSLKDTKERITELCNQGLKSLTVSFDGNEDELNDDSSSLKSGNGIETLRWFMKTFDYRDAAVVFTLTKTNLESILKWIPVLSKEGIFVFFDLIHSDIGNPGTKCRNYEGIDELLFSMEDADKLRKFAAQMIEMKKEGKYTIHQSNTFLDVLHKTPERYINYEWNCAKDFGFPAWLSIDNDGLARVCDDFYIKGEKDWYFWELTPEVFNGEYTEYWKEKTIQHCKGCFWNTHWDAHRIKQGDETFEDYVNNSL